MAVMTRGFSETAKFVEESQLEARRSIGHSITFGRDSVLQEIAVVYRECCRENWDGSHALPVLQETMRQAYGVVESLPIWVPSPIVGCEPDGHLTLEWYRSPRSIVSVSISPDGELNCAALIGSSRLYCTDTFNGDFPEMILQLIQRIAR